MIGAQRAAFGPAQIQRLLHVVQAQKAGPTERGNAARAEIADPTEFRSGPISSLLEGEVLHLIAHSSPAEFGGMEADELAFYLIERGLPEHVEAVQLHGCESTSFAADLHVALKGRRGEWLPRGDLRVQGIPGFSFISDEGINYSLGADKGDDDVAAAANYDPKLYKRALPSLRQDQSGNNVRSWMKEFPGALVKIDTMASSDEAIRSLLPAAVEVLEERLDSLDRDWVMYEDDFDLRGPQYVEVAMRIRGLLRRAEGVGDARIEYLRGLLNMAEQEAHEIEQRNREFSSTGRSELRDSRGEPRGSGEQASRMNPSDEVDLDDPFAEGWE